MSHPTLLQRLTEMKFHQGLIKISENFLHSRKQTVTNFRLRPPEPKDYLISSCGVPQGSILGPWLWISYANSIGDEELQDRAVYTKYADDITISQAIYKKDIEIEYSIDSTLYVDLAEKRTFCKIH